MYDNDLDAFFASIGDKCHDFRLYICFSCYVFGIICEKFIFLQKKRCVMFSSLFKTTSSRNLLGILLLCLAGVGQAFAAWDGSIATTAPGDTTIDGKVFYKISNEKELAWFAAQVNSGKKSYNAKLMANLDMGGKLWTPIGAGNNKNNYNGTFDGNEHVISNLYISAEELIEKYSDINMAQNIGFIGCFSGTVKNLILENIEVHGYGKGGIGNATNLVDKPISIGTVVGWQSKDASVIDGCYATGVVITSGDGQAVGGIVGNVGSGTVKNCYSAVDIYASGLAYVGGIAGYTKKYEGTLVTMESCVYAGENLSTEGSADVGGKDSSGRVGAIIGYQYKGNVILSDLYYDAEQFPEGGVGATTGGSTTGSTTPKSDLNSAEVICLLNGGTYSEGTCTGADQNPSWEMGESGPVLNDYSVDGFKITFDANGGTFAENATSAEKYVKLDYVINDDGIAKPSRDDFAFIGWSTNKDATEPDQNLGTVSGALTVYAIWNPIYTITFSATPGSFPGEDLGVVKTVKVEKNKKIAVKDFIVPSFYLDQGVKYSFMGWSTKENPEEEDALVDENGLDDLPIATDNITLYAVWTEATIYTVTFDANGHGPSIANYVKVKNVYDHEKATALTDDDFEHADGYSLDTEDGSGWCIDSECSAEFDFNTPIEENKTLYAKWKTDKYVVTYENLNGASNSNPSEYTVDGLALVDPSWDEAHRFLGWFRDSEFKNKVSSIPAGTTGALTLYAEWETVTYTIIYKAGTGGIGSLSPAEKIHDENYVLPDTTYTRDGYLQNGWGITDCGEKVFDFGGVYEANKDTSFYPAWNIITYTIEYVCEHDCEDLDETKYPRTYNVESSFGLQNLSSIAGYKFGGWYKESAYTTKISNIQKGSIGNLKLYGKWNVIYNITYVGTDNPNSAKTYTVDESVKFNKPKNRTGYTFGGWYSDAEFENEVTGIEKGSSGDTTIYAKWIPESYPIVYHNIEGATFETENPETYTVEDGNIDLNSPSKSGYNFLGWSLEENSTEYVDGIAAGSTGEANFYANWEKTYPFLVNDYGAIKVYENEKGQLTAEIDGMSKGDVDVITPEDSIFVNYINFNREFPVNAADSDKMYSTIVLPFSIDKSKVPSAEFYELKAVDVPNKTVEFWSTKGTLQANTPYIIRTEEATLSFNLDEGETVALNTSELNNSSSEDGLWEFRGTYSYRKWQDGDSDLGRAYGFRGNARDSYSIGSFARIGAGAAIRPFRAYLLKVANQQSRRYTLAKSSVALNTASIVEETVPSTLDVVIVDRETEQTTVIGKLNTATGEIKIIDNWFDMKGRKLNGKPTTKGIYYYNGKRVMVK